MVSVAGNFYSVPDATRRRVVEVHTLAEELRIFEDGALIAIHPILEGRHQRHVEPGHRNTTSTSADKKGMTRSFFMARATGSLSARWPSTDAVKSVYFCTLDELIAALARAEREGRLQERIRFFCRPALLVIDEIGYLPVVHGGGQSVLPTRQRPLRKGRNDSHLKSRLL